MSNTLKFYLGEESHYIVENYEEKDYSLFTDQYNKALSIIDLYIDSQEGNNGDKQGNLRNNIVAFLGDRGTGKTSCMLSVLNMLDKHFEKKNFAKIDAIDPSFFDENTNILFLVIGKMFAAFKKAMEYSDSRMGRKNQEEHDLRKSFHDVQSCLSRMQKSPLDDDDNDMNQLSNLLVTVELKENLEKLVNNYLKFFGSDYLVVPIDDIDNNTQHAYTMAEQLRKYLVLPNVIILISFKLEQLAHVIDLYFSKMYESLIEQKRFSTEDIADMTQKYLLKLMPLNQRVTLPNMDVMMDRELEVYKNREEKSPEQDLSGSSVKYAMTELIFRKTRYLFYHSTNETCPIVPANLREYRTLHSMLCNMVDYNKEKEEYNKRLFLDYFYEDWTDKHLNEEGKKIARRLIENKEASSFNKLVLKNLSTLISITEFQELLSDDDDESTLENKNTKRNSNQADIQKQSEFKLVTNDNNSVYNISIGDVFAVINEIKKQVVAEEDKMLLFFIESLYSIKLYHYYDEITEPNSNSCKNEKIDQTIKRLDMLDGVSNYEKLIGGNFFNPNMLRLLPMEGRSSISRAYRVIDLKPLRTLLKKEKIDDWGLNTIEFFALTLSRRLYSKTKNDVYPKYRQKQEVYYRSDLSNPMITKAVFDLGSFFSNIIDIKHAYNRFDKNLYELAGENKNSLLNKIKQETINNYEELKNKDYDNSYFLSWCCIRNAVILQDFGDSFSYIKTGRTQSSDQLQLLEDFFKQVSKYTINTYDKTNNNDAYKVNFGYAKVFSDYFMEMQNNDDARILFYNVYNIENPSKLTSQDINNILSKYDKTLMDRITDELSKLKNNEDFIKSQIIKEVIPSKLYKTQAIVSKTNKEQKALSLNIDSILNNCKNVILKDTLKTRIIKNNPEIKDNIVFWNVFNSHITTPKISKQQARQALQELKKQFGN